MTAPCFRSATADDLPAILALLRDDALGAERERADEAHYRRAMVAILADPNNEILVMEIEGALAGCLQLTYIPGLSRKGAWRAQIESVRIGSSLRGRGLGRRLFEAAIARAQARGCRIVQLTSDKRRRDAQGFYRGLGFVASHEGYKLALAPASVQAAAGRRQD
ncbi:MAG: GNAT family N-acetyltransferase [Kiloniellales bacterium]